MSISAELRELYQELIIDHNRNPRHYHAMDDATTHAHGFNPLCGDKVTVYLKIDKHLSMTLSFLGTGCAISQASASLMADALQGKTVNEAHELFHRVHEMLTKPKDEDAFEFKSMERLSVLAGVKAFPARVKCATLAWQAMQTALNKLNDTQAKTKACGANKGTTTKGVII